MASVPVNATGADFVGERDTLKNRNILLTNLYGWVKLIHSYLCKKAANFAPWLSCKVLILDYNT